MSPRWIVDEELGKLVDQMTEAARFGQEGHGTADDILLKALRVFGEHVGPLDRVNALIDLYEGMPKWYD